MEMGGVVWLDEERAGVGTVILIVELSGPAPRREATELVERRVVDEDGGLDVDVDRWTEFRMPVGVDWLLVKVVFPWLELLPRPSTT